MKVFQLIAVKIPHTSAMSRFETLELTTSECVSRFTLFVCIEFNWNEMVWVPYRCVSGSIWLETCHRSGNKILHELFRMTCYHFQKNSTEKSTFSPSKFDSLHWLGSYDERNSHGHLIASSRKTTLLKHLDHQPLHYRYQPGSCQEKKTSSAYGKWCKKIQGFSTFPLVGWVLQVVELRSTDPSLVISHEQSSKTHQWHSMILVG